MVFVKLAAVDQCNDGTLESKIVQFRNPYAATKPFFGDAGPAKHMRLTSAEGTKKFRIFERSAYLQIMST